jgi:hypothetical protein
MHLMFIDNDCSIQINLGNCEKRTSLLTSACKCAEHSAFESMWLSTNVNDSELDCMECWDCQEWYRELHEGDQSVCWTYFLFRMNTEVKRHLKEIYLSAKMILVFLICSLASRLKHLLSLVFLRTRKHGLPVIKIILTEKLELHGDCLKSLCRCAASLKTCIL